MSRIRVKICGITSPEDAELAAELGADYLGLNFYDRSPRYVGLARAREIVAAVADRADVVGVFVNAPPSTIERIDDGDPLIRGRGHHPLLAADVGDVGEAAVARDQRGCRRDSGYRAALRGVTGLSGQ